MSIRSKKLLSAGLLVGLAILLGRLLGFSRELLLARTFGRSESADWAVLLFSIPDMFVNLLLGGALAAVFIPEWARRDRAAGQRLHVTAALGVLFFFSGLAVLLWIFQNKVFSILAPGLEGRMPAEGTFAFLFVLVAIPLTGLSGVLAAYANFRGLFFVPALGTAVLNFAVVAGIFFAGYSSAPLVIFGSAILAGAGVRLLMQLFNLRRAPPYPAPNLSADEQKVPSLWLRYIQALSAASLLVLLPVVGRAAASEFGSGQMAIFNYAHKMIELPIGLCVTVIATVLLPKLSRLLVDRSSMQEVVSMFTVSMRGTVQISFAIAIPGIYYAQPIAAFLFGSSEIESSDIRTISELMAVGFLALPLQGLIAILVCVYNALRANSFPMVASAITILTLFLILPFTTASVGLVGVPLALVLAQFILLVLLALVLRSKIRLPYFAFALEPTFIKGVLLSLSVFILVAVTGRLIDVTEGIQPFWAVMASTLMLVCMLAPDPKYWRRLAQPVKGDV